MIKLSQSPNDFLSQEFVFQCSVALTATVIATIVAYFLKWIISKIGSKYDRHRLRTNWHKLLDKANLDPTHKDALHDWYDADKSFEDSIREKRIREYHDAPTPLSKALLLREIVNEEIKRIIREHRDKEFTTNDELEELKEQFLSDQATQELPDQYESESRQDVDEA